MVFGTPFEQLEDDESGNGETAISKRPKGIQDEIVTDERGRRRFHGAFTGGFSAGYFNTAGSKHGWIPQTFKSSREDRAEKTQQAAQDFMDEEDLGEFGIAARKLRPKVDFMDSLLSSSTPGEKRLLAWERSSTTLSSSSAPAAGEGAGDGNASLVGKLTEMLRPVSDSVGVRLLKKMGWRPGKGIGAKMSRRELERQKATDAKSAGRSGNFDEEAVREVEEYAQGPMEFSPDDITMAELRPKEDLHGLGYRPLRESGVLSQKYGVMEAALKVNKKSKGIRGQAFGVGAFEEEDEDIYTSFDLTQYDFEVGASSGSATQDVPKFDSTFVPASTSGKKAPQNFFVAPQPPPGWRPHPHRPKISSRDQQQKESLKLPESVAKISERLTPFQRAKLLGERDHSVMEMLSSADREKLKERGKEERSERRNRHNEPVEPFEEEPMKAHRFKQFVNYLKRGIPFPQPVDMTRLEWERESAQFQEALTPELRSLLPEVRDRQKPLAKVDFSQPIAEHLKSRFEKEAGNMEDVKHMVVKDERVEAVKMKQFGAMTRQKYAWHPARDLCKRFNVPNPYPDSQLVGAPGLSRATQKDYSAQYSLMDLGGLRDTAAEMASQQRRQHHHHSRFDQKGEEMPAGGEGKEIKKEVEEKGAEEEAISLVPMELLAAIFGDDDNKEPEDEREEEEEEEECILKLPAKRKLEEQKERKEERRENGTRKRDVVSILDLVPDDDVYGPMVPPTELLLPSSSSIVEEKKNGRIAAGDEEKVITVEESEEEWKKVDSREEEKKKRKKTKKKERKKVKKAKKHSKKRKEKKNVKRSKHGRSRHSSGQSSTSSLSSDID